MAHNGGKFTARLDTRNSLRANLGNPASLPPLFLSVLTRGCKPRRHLGVAAGA